MKILITGITGMVGSHLSEYLLGFGDDEIHGTIRWRSSRRHIASFENRLRLHECELRDPYAVLRLLEEIRPDRIYHLASQSSVASSWNSPRDTLVNNTTIQLNIFEAMRNLKMVETPVLIPGSSEEYGLVYENELPVNEFNQLRPLSPYAVSKITQNTMAYQYYKNFGIQTMRTRAFNHLGTGQADIFVASSFAKQIAEIENGTKKPFLLVGNLDAVRDFTDIQDIVNAYVLALEKGEPGELYNIGSGVGWRIKDILQTLLKMSSVDIEIRKDPNRMRPSDVPAMICDNTKFSDQTGWKPTISIEQSLFEVLQYWRIRVQRGVNSDRSADDQILTSMLSLRN